MGAGEEAPAEAQWAPRGARVMAEHVGMWNLMDLVGFRESGGLCLLSF